MSGRGRLLSALDQARRGASGQIGTFLIILMVFVLIMGLFLTNLGQLSAESVRATNAADASTLFLASQLASKANQICKHISKQHKLEDCADGKEGLRFCKRTGILPFIAGAVVVAVGVVTGHPELVIAGSKILGAAVVGAAVTAAVAAASGFDMRQVAFSALMGAAIGASLAVGIPFVIDKVFPFLVGIPVVGPTLAGLSVDAAVFGPIALGASGFNALVGTGPAVAVTAQAISAVTKQIGALPEYERIREGTLLQALSRVVDDPNTTVGPDGKGGCWFPERYSPAVGDPWDLNGNGNTSEAIPCFEYWWNARVNTLQSILSPVARQNIVTNFIEDWLRDRRDKARQLLFYLERSEAECACAAEETDGPAVRLWRRLHGADYDVSTIWQPGPDEEGVRGYVNSDCDPASDPDCLVPPDGWDSVDAVRLRYERFVTYANSLVYNPVVHGPFGFSTEERWYRLVTNGVVGGSLSMLYGVPFLAEGSYYRDLEAIAGEIGGWLETTDRVQRQLPGCHLAYGEYPPTIPAQQLPPVDPPICEHRQIVTDPDTGLTDDLDPIDNCTWYDQPLPAETGVHIPAADFNPELTKERFPLCKVDERHQAGLLTQVGTVDAFAGNLKPHIEQNYATHFFNPAAGYDGVECTADPAGLPPLPSCQPLNQPCDVAKDCCSNTCDACTLEKVGGPCGSSANCCSGSCSACSKTPVGGACTSDDACCSGSCAGGCVGGVPAGGTCESDGDCCSGSCSACSLTPIGGTCTSDGECCSGSCAGGCVSVPVGGACQSDGDCCSGSCFTLIGICVGADPTGSCAGSDPASVCAGPDPASACASPDPTGTCAGSDPAGVCEGSDPASVCGGTEPKPVYTAKRITPDGAVRVVGDASAPAISLSLRKWDGAPAADDLEYKYTYTYQCQQCVDYGGRINCNSPYWVTKEGACANAAGGACVKRGIGAPDLAIPNGPTGDAAFLDYGPFRAVLTGQGGFQDTVSGFEELYGTIDADLDDEFAEVRELLAADQEGLASFLGAVEGFYEALQEAMKVPPAKDGRLPNDDFVFNDPIRGGLHPIDGRYEWQDSRGYHSAEVRVGPFITPESREAGYGSVLLGKKCVELVNYCENTPGCPYPHRNPRNPFVDKAPGRTWVWLILQGPTERQTGFWKWNPFHGAIRKMARGSYDRNYVGLCETGGKECP